MAIDNRLSVIVKQIVQMIQVKDNVRLFEIQQFKHECLRIFFRKHMITCRVSFNASDALTKIDWKMCRSGAAVVRT
ncbi:MAG: hypothetical protein GX285_06395 [Clostridiales bacterium]|nr:hypothetical protein [Clostridiales bacterium]